VCFCVFVFVFAALQTLCKKTIKHAWLVLSGQGRWNDKAVHRSKVTKIGDQEVILICKFVFVGSVFYGHRAVEVLSGATSWSDVTLIRLALITPLSLPYSPVPMDQSEIVCQFVQGIDSVIRFTFTWERRREIICLNVLYSFERRNLNSFYFYCRFDFVRRLFWRFDRSLISLH
jgi:hypothetical protein